MSRFKASEMTRAMRAARAAGLESFDVVPLADGTPVVRVRPANDTPADLIDELEQWRREQQQKDHAA